MYCRAFLPHHNTLCLRIFRALPPTDSGEGQNWKQRRDAAEDQICTGNQLVSDLVLHFSTMYCSPFPVQILTNKYQKYKSVELGDQLPPPPPFSTRLEIGLQSSSSLTLLSLQYTTAVIYNSWYFHNEMALNFYFEVDDDDAHYNHGDHITTPTYWWHWRSPHVSLSPVSPLSPDQSKCWNSNSFFQNIISASTLRRQPCCI